MPRKKGPLLDVTKKYLEIFRRQPQIGASDSPFPDPNARLQTTQFDNGTINIRNPATGNARQFDPMMAAGFAGPMQNVTKMGQPLANAAQQTVTRHITSATQVLKEMPNVSMKPLLDNLSKDIVAGLIREGKNAAAQAVKSLNTAAFSSPDDFGRAVSKALMSGVAISKAAGPLSKMSPENVKSLSKALSSFDELDDAAIKSVKEFLTSAGYEVPASKAGLKDMLETAFQSVFDAQMWQQVARQKLPTSMKPTVNQPQPHDKLGRWDFIKRLLKK